jgi:hypothetical protein
MNRNKVIQFCISAIAIIGLTQFCSCATASREPDSTPASNLPGEVAMNRFSRFAPYLMVTLHLENGTEFKCYVDTGSPSSLLPKLLEPQLGKRLGKHRIRTLDGSIEKENIYAAPKIYLGDAQLVTGNRMGVWTNAEGILGMDCLRHYCLQLDFQTQKIRFLKSGDTNSTEWGKAFPLTSLRYAHIRQKEFFQMNDSSLLVDTGDPFDGMMSSRLLKRAVQEEKARPVPIIMPRHFQGKLPKLDLFSFPTCVWNGETYSNLVVQAGRVQLIGLKFLARHQVTFDFPKKMMYLKYSGEQKVHTEAITSENKEEAISFPDHRSEQSSADAAHRP